MSKQILIKSVLAGITIFGLLEFFTTNSFNWLFWAVIFGMPFLFNPYIFVIIWGGIKQSVRELPVILGSVVSPRQK